MKEGSPVLITRSPFTAPSARDMANVKMIAAQTGNPA